MQPYHSAHFWHYPFSQFIRHHSAMFYHCSISSQCCISDYYQYVFAWRCHQPFSSPCQQPFICHQPFAPFCHQFFQQKMRSIPFSRFQKYDMKVCLLDAVSKHFFPSPLIWALIRCILLKTRARRNLHIWNFRTRPTLFLGMNFLHIMPNAVSL